MDLPLGWLVVLWFLMAALAVVLPRRLGRPSVGLVGAYLIYLAWIHWVPILLYVLPWYRPLNNPEIVRLGFDQSLLGLIGFVIGAISLSALRRRSGSTDNASVSVIPDENEQLPRIFFWLGLAAYFILIPTFGSIATISAAVSGLANLLYAGVLLLWWQSGHHHRSRTRLALVCLVIIWPLVTVSGQGFLGAGLTLPIMLFVFGARTVRHPWLGGIVSLALVYFVISVSVTYSSERGEIRAVAWDEAADSQARIGASLLIFERFQWFDPYNFEHLDRIETHTNQNYLVGLAVDRIEQGRTLYARGSTLAEVGLMLIPRALWPDKPIRVGGSSYISEFTGVYFYGPTSVGMGQIMEFYVNFGAIGVFVSMIIFGLLITALDEIAAQALYQKDWFKFTLWYVPALSLLQTGNNLFVLVAGFASSWLVIYLMKRVWHPRTNAPSKTIPRYVSVRTQG